MKLAVVGVTGLVGGVMLEVLQERNFQIDEFIPVASARSAGKKMTYLGKEYTIVTNEEAVAMKPDIAIFSAGGDTSKEWAPQYAAVGCTVIDNSSAWRMSPDHKLVVPEINAHELTPSDKIIANPNCSTIQMVVALAPLHRQYNIKRLVISTYQSYTGTGVNAVKQYDAERESGKYNADGAAYPHPIFANCIPHCDIFLDNGYTKEEMKLVHETKKILNSPNIKVTATAVRVPVDGGHSESVNVEFENNYELPEVIDILQEADGIVVQNSNEQYDYPMPLFAKGKDEVFVGRIRRDESADNSLNLWIVSDNLRKGAATNAVQIAEYLVKKEMA